MRLTVAVIALLIPRSAAAHAGAHGPHDLWQTWTLEPWVIALLLLSGILYAAGWRRLGRRTRPRADRSRRRWFFVTGWLSLVVALVSPVDALGELLFSGHMVQHLLLTLVAAPLLVMSDAGTMILWAMRRTTRRAVGRLLRSHTVRSAWRALSHPISAWTLQAVALVLWHTPYLYELAIVEPRIHALEHWTFLATALVYWWPVVSPHPRRRLAFGTAVVYLFTAATASGILGAMMAMSNAAWYSVHARWTLAWGLTPLEDQQLAGLIMWVPASMIYLAAAVPLALRSLSNHSSDKALATSH